MRLCRTPQAWRGSRLIIIDKANGIASSPKALYQQGKWHRDARAPRSSARSSATQTDATGCAGMYAPQCTSSQYDPRKICRSKVHAPATNSTATPHAFTHYTHSHGTCVRTVRSAQQSRDTCTGSAARVLSTSKQVRCSSLTYSQQCVCPRTVPLLPPIAQAGSTEPQGRAAMLLRVL